MKKFLMILVSIIMILSLVSCAKSETTETVEDEEVVIEDSTEEPPIEGGEEPADEEDNILDLGNGYSFIRSKSDTPDSYESPKYALILKDGIEEARFNYERGGYLTYIGTHNDAFYFNFGSVVSADGVYKYAPKSSEFEELCTDLNFERFDRELADNAWDMKHAGIMDDRYILAVPYYPTDGYNGYGTAYVYDLETNERTELGTARDIINTSDGIYWTDTDPYHFGEGKPFNILVKKASHSGSNITTIKTIPVNEEGINYGIGYIDRRTVNWGFSGDYPNVSEVYRDDDNDYVLKEDLEVREEPSDDAKIKKRSELSEDGQKNALPGDDAVLKKGTVVTCLDFSGNWMKIPSGYIKYRDGEKVYVKYYE